MKTNKLIILTAGGTGGHIYPAEALADELSNRGYNLMLVTDARGKNNYKGKLGKITNCAVCSGALVGKSKFFKLKSLCKLTIGIFQSIWILLNNRPACVVGFGGYASFPCCVAAILLRQKLVIHEQNSVMSRTNRFLARYASLIATSFPTTKSIPLGKKTILTGMPIRQSISALYDLPFNQPNSNGDFNLLVLGGSQGAKIFSDTVPEAIKLLSIEQQKRINLTQQCRKDDLENLQKKYATSLCKTDLSSFFSNMPELYKNTHLIISRSGASSVCEIAAAGIPSILVPLPTAADNHQTFNAAEFEQNKGGIVIAQKEFNAEKLSSILTNLMQNPKELAMMSENTKKFAITNAAERLGDVIENKIINQK